MNEHLAAWQIAEFNLGGLDEDESRDRLSAPGRVRDLVGGRRAGRGLRVKAERQESKAIVVGAREFAKLVEASGGSSSMAFVTRARPWR